MSGELWVWHCFKWTGRESDLDDFDRRCDPASALPPLSRRGWLHKSAYLHEASYDCLTTTQRWLEVEMRQTAEQLADLDEHWIGEIKRQYRAKAAELSSNPDICWRHWLPHGRAVCLGVIRQPRPPRHSKP